VFIGIVVAAMVKNTGAQSAASLGYGSAMVMNSTARSGVVATEGFFLNNPERGVAFIENAISNGPGSFVSGNKKGALRGFRSILLQQSNKRSKQSHYNGRKCESGISGRSGEEP
jgi:hypothetical protein